MEFESDYWHSLDYKENKKLDINPGSLGISTPPFRDQVESLRTRIFQGASRIELGFTGAGKGNLAQGSTTPEQYGKNEREAIRQLAKLNEVQLSTHATFGIGGLAGFNPQEGGFSREASEQALHEVERAVDFAADTAGGGPIVVHTQEFPRPIYKVKPEGVKGEFEGFPEEREKGMIYFADKDTGKVNALKMDEIISMPRYKDPEHTELGYVRDENDHIKIDTMTIGEYSKKLAERKKLNPEEAALESLKDFNRREIQRLVGERERFDRDVRTYEKVVGDLQGLKKDFEDILPEVGNKEAARTVLRQRLKASGITPKTDDEQKQFINEPEKLIDGEIKNIQSWMNSYRETVVGISRELATAQRKIDSLVPLEQVGLERSTETIARAAMFAYDKERSMKLERPLFIAPENLFDTSYGSDPRELRKVIETSRKKMEDELVDKRHMDRNNAAKIAEDHIKATFDIGHLNTWRKYFKAPPGTDPDKEFQKWVLKEVEDLQKKKIIGHVHLSDNFGYYDEHVSPGFGNAPVSEFVKKLKELGYKGTMIVEPGHQDARAWTEAMRSLQSPIYKSKSWTDVEFSYFGGTYNPPYVVGGYAPDVSLGDEHRDWKFWSGVPIE